MFGWQTIIPNVFALHLDHRLFAFYIQEHRSEPGQDFVENSRWIGNGQNFWVPV